MKKLRVVNTALTLSAGCIELTEAQATPRMGSLKRVKANVYEITGPVQFKVGEQIGYDGDLPKSLVGSLTSEKELRETERGTTDSTEAAS